MNERVVEILMFIMNHIKSSDQDMSELELLSQDLLERGYSQNEISSAFSWLFERINSGFEELLRATDVDTSSSFRVLHELEQMIIKPEAFGYLLQMRELKLLDQFDFEQVIERALTSGSGKVGIEEIKSVVASVLSGADFLPSGNMIWNGDQSDEIH